jgi:hypothetical protein
MRAPTDQAPRDEKHHMYHKTDKETRQNIVTSMIGNIKHNMPERKDDQHKLVKQKPKGREF